MDGRPPTHNQTEIDMTNLDDFRDEYVADKAAEEAAAAAQKALDDAYYDMRREADRENANRDKAAAHNAFLQRMANCLPLQCRLAPAYNPDSPWKALQVRIPVSIEGEARYYWVSTYHDLSIEDDYTSGGWRSKPTGHKRIVVGNYGDDRRTYRVRSDGSYNWEKIAEKLREHAEKRVRRQVREEAYLSNRSASAQLKEDLGLESYSSGIEASSVPGKPIHFKYAIERHLTVEEAKELIAKLESIGITVGYKKKPAQ